MEGEDSALVSSKENLPREAQKTNDSTFDRIYKFYHNDKSRVELKEDEKVIAQRWEKAWFLLVHHRTKKQAADMLSHLFSISKSVAYDDVRNAMILFTDPSTDLKEAKRAIAETALLQGAAKAWKTGDLEMHHKYMKEYSDINGLKENSQDGALANIIKNLKPAQVIIVANQKELDDEINNLQQEITMDMPHTDVE